MAAEPFFLPFPTAFNSNGLAIPGAQLRFRYTGTTTAAPIYSEASLTTALTNPVVANGAGRFVPIYLDSTITYRLDILDAGGVQLDSVDPYVPGISSAVLTAAAGSAVTTIALLSQISSPTSGQAAFLTESGREGMFVFSTGDLSASVTLDTYQGIYVAPSTASTGASGAWVRKYDGPVNLSWFGMANGAGSNTARFESAIALFGGGAEFLLPRGTIDFATQPRILKNVILRGHGDGPSNGTTCQFPSDVDGFRLVYTPSTADCYDSVLSDFKITHTGRSERTDTNVSFSTESHAVTLSAVGTWQNGQTVRVEAAGPSLTIVGKTAAITSGTNTVSVTNTTARGNTCAHVGQHIVIAGAGVAGANLTTTITAVTSTTITLAANASTTVTAAAYTLKLPLFATILSGAGTTTLELDVYSEFQNATGVTMTRAETGIVQERVAQIRRISFGGQYLNMLMHGSATAGGGDNANTSQVKDCRFGSSLVCLYVGGYDANASGFWGCDFSNYTQYGVIENSLIGNFFIGCHFAFNTGFVCGVAGNLAAVTNAYVEDGTGMAGNGSGNQMVGNQYFPAGGGFAGWVTRGSGLEFPGGVRTENIDVTDAFYKNGTKIIAGLGAAVSDITVTATAGTLPTANGSVTIADATVPTVVELLEYCRELEATLETVLARMRALTPSIAT